MSELIINGGNKLSGEVVCQSAKNSVVTLIASTILYNGKVTLRGCKKLSDIVTMCEIFKKIGGKYYFNGENLTLDSTNIDKFGIDNVLSKKIRSSFFMTGALLSRFGCAQVIFPGGCKIGKRPIDIHISCLKELGVSVETSEDKIDFKVNKTISGKTIRLSYPSVGATENVIMACVFCNGSVVIKNVAKEPEIKDLQNLLNLYGCKVSGAGSDTIVVSGVKKLRKDHIFFTPIGDRIEAGTYMLSCAVCGGEMVISNVYSQNISLLSEKFDKNHCKIICFNDKIYIKCGGRFKSSEYIETGPFPSFPTDLQAPFCSLACVSNGDTVIRERVFENRFGHLAELKKMGADICVFKDLAIITGVNNLHGETVFACDLRAGAGLIIAGLYAQGKTVVKNLELVDRGYYQIEKTLTRLGAKIKRDQC